MTEQTNQILKAILATIGREAFSPEQIHAIVNPKGNGIKQIRAYNLADGSRTQGEIQKALKLDAGNFSRQVARWIENGVLFKFDENKLLHLYVVPEKLPKGD